MNPNNYGTLPACQRLAEAGIVLETEKVWHLQGDNETYFLQDQGSSAELCVRWGDYPAPSLAEVWRELPPGTELRKAHSFTEAFSFADTENADSIYPPCNSPDNPTDALIDLLIWLRRDFNAKHDCP